MFTFTYLSDLLELILVTPTVVVLTAFLCRCWWDFQFIFTFWRRWRWKWRKRKVVVSLWLDSLLCLLRWHVKTAKVWRVTEGKWGELFFESFKKLALLLCKSFWDIAWWWLVEVFLWWRSLEVFAVFFVFSFGVWSWVGLWKKNKLLSRVSSDFYLNFNFYPNLLPTFSLFYSPQTKIIKSNS